MDDRNRLGTAMPQRHQPIDNQGDQVPRIGWREAAARNRADGAVRVALRALAEVATVVADEQDVLDRDVFMACTNALGEAREQLDSAGIALRKGGHR